MFGHTLSCVTLGSFALRMSAALCGLRASADSDAEPNCGEHGGPTLQSAGPHSLKQEDAMDGFLVLFVFILGVVLVVAQFQLFAIKRYLHDVTTAAITLAPIYRRSRQSSLKSRTIRSERRVRSLRANRGVNALFVVQFLWRTRSDSAIAPHADALGRGAPRKLRR
jgi:hypothetical protein